MESMEEALLANLQTFIAFARSRLGDPHLAEDVVQDSLLKALSSNNQPTTKEDSITWFYRILRHSIIDLHRRAGTRSRTLEKFAAEFPENPGEDDAKTLCQCFRRLLPGLPDKQRELLQRIDLDGEDVGKVALSLGLNRNTAGVRLHRARKQLRDELTRNCRACAKHGCLDCTCGENESPGD
jgi:RNA polymerase sigma-70 factor (ECF subfamily)